ncbi:MAG: hypothetical protein V3V67_11470 [Myxococcota bacterium]
MSEPASLDPEEAASERSAWRWALARDVIVLQLKLVLEGVRDVTLGPLGLIAGLWGIVTGAEHPGQLFRRVLRASARFDAWLNLYGALDRAPPGEIAERPRLPGASADEWFDRIERAVVDQYEKGGLTRTAKDQIDRLLDRAQERRRIEAPK